MIAVLDVGSTVNNTAQFAPVHGAAAHEAGLDGYIEGCFLEILGAEGLEGGGHCDHFRMGGGVVQTFYLVMAAADDLITPNDYGTYRVLRLRRKPVGLREGRCASGARLCLNAFSQFAIFNLQFAKVML